MENFDFDYQHKSLPIDSAQILTRQLYFEGNRAITFICFSPEFGNVRWAVLSKDGSVLDNHVSNTIYISIYLSDGLKNPVDIRHEVFFLGPGGRKPRFADG